MLSLLIPLVLLDTQSPQVAQARLVAAPHIVRDLPGWLNDTPVLFSNSPELVQTPGILVSTFPAAGKKVPGAHLNETIKGEFAVFSHHVAQRRADGAMLHTGLLLHNPGIRTATVSITQAASFLTRPDAPFYSLPPQTENQHGQVFSGPGDRTADFLLRGLSQKGWPKTIVIPPGDSRMLYSLPIPVHRGSRNTRCIMVRASTNEPLYAASLASFATSKKGQQSAGPSISQWKSMLHTSGRAGPDDHLPTAPGSTSRPVYGRVAGVALGSRWRVCLSDDPYGAARLDIPEPGTSIAYVLSSLEQGAFGTKKLQSAPLVARYPTTSHSLHGNYGVEYNLYLPLHNKTSTKQRVTLTLQTPLKSNMQKGGVIFSFPPQRPVWFRGTLRLRYRDDRGTSLCRYVHVVQHQGDAGEPLLTATLVPGETRAVSVEFIYPADATPPQILTLSTEDDPQP